MGQNDPFLDPFLDPFWPKMAQNGPPKLDPLDGKMRDFALIP